MCDPPFLGAGCQETSMAGGQEAAAGLPRTAGDRAEPWPAPRDAQQLRRAVGAAPDRQVRPGVEAVAVRQTDGVGRRGGGQQVRLLQRRFGHAAAEVGAADTGREEHPGSRRRRPQARPRRAVGVPPPGDAEDVRGQDRRRGAAPRRGVLGRPRRRHGAAADEAANVRRHRLPALRPRARRRRPRRARRRLRARDGGHVGRAGGPAVHGVQAERQGRHQRPPAARRDHAGEEGRAGARHGHAEQRPHRLPAHPDRRPRRAAAVRGGDRRHRHGGPHRRPRHLLHPHDLHGPPPRQRPVHPGRHGPRARGDREEQARRRGADMGGPDEDEADVARRAGDAAHGASHLRQLQESTRGHRVRRLRHPQGVAGVLGGERDAHGREHLPRADQVRAVTVRQPVVFSGDGAGAAVLLRGVRRRAEDLPRDRVREDRDAGDDAPFGQEVQVESLLQGGHLREGPHADAAAWSAHRNRAQDFSLITTRKDWTAMSNHDMNVALQFTE